MVQKGGNMGKMTAVPQPDGTYRRVDLLAGVLKSDDPQFAA